MAGPPIRRPPTKPPPLPARAPIAPAPAKTDVVPTQQDPDERDEVSEITKNLEAPDAGQLVQNMLVMVASEAEALLVGDDSDGRLADLNVRTALASWDGLREPEEAMRYLELAENHPLAPRLHLSAALGQRAPEPLAIVQLRVDGLPASDMKTALAVELAEAWLFRYGRAEQAAVLCDVILAQELPPAWKPHIAQLASLVYAAIGKWDRVVSVRRGALTSSSSLEEVASTAAFVLDRGNDALGALALCWEAIERIDASENGGDTQPSISLSRAGQLRVIDIAIDAAARANDPRMLELLDRRGELVTSLPGGAL
ncbi:MAG TPA: hypothetical protein VIV11_25325, partial [Kofleriaceae bacterium]